MLTPQARSSRLYRCKTCVWGKTNVGNAVRCSAIYVWTGTKLVANENCNKDATEIYSCVERGRE